MLDVSLIRLDGGTQTRAERSDDVVKDYAAEMLLGAQFPPVTVFFDGSDYWLADGFHRVAAAIAAGLTEVAADVRQGTRRDAVLFSVGANASHGLRRTNADKRRAVETLLRDDEWQKWTDVQVAKQCGVSSMFVGNMRKELGIIKPFNDTRTATRNGQTYEMNTANIGRESLPFDAETDDDAFWAQGSDDDVWNDNEDMHAQAWANRQYKGNYASCKYCYETHDQWTQASGYDGIAWLCERCEHVTRDEFMQVEDAPAQKPANYSSESNEWYTPAIYINAARDVLGGFDTDPASNDQAQGVIQAATYYTIDDDGFNKPWHGRVWLNPPYGTEQGKSRAGLWGARLIEQYRAGITTEAVLLVNATPERKWFQPFWDFPVCLTNHRIKYEVPDGATDDDPDQPVYGSAFVYLGSNVARFVEVFSQFGPVLCRMSVYDGQVFTLLDEVAA